MEQFYKQGEFTHDSSNPFLNFVSSVLDITIIKPIIDGCIGKDLITGEAFNAIQGADKADTVVLGKFDALKDANENFVYDANGNLIPTDKSYNKVAEQMGAQYFQLDNWDELAAKYDDNEIWKINEKFLDIQIASGREIYLSANPEEFIDGTSFYSKELQYLEKHGYHFVKEGDIWHAVQ